MTWGGAQAQSAYGRANDYIREEFFAMDAELCAKVLSLYRREYGSGAYSYLLRTFDDWRSGRVGMSGQTAYRILHCVPKCLPAAKQFKILSFYIPEFARTVTKPSRTEYLGATGICPAFVLAAKQCCESRPNLDWFISGVFSEAEIDAFCDVARYAVQDRLHKLYAAVRLDLVGVRDALAGLDASIELQYRIDELNAVVQLDGMVPHLPLSAFELPPIPTLVAQNRKEYERLLLEHDCEMIAQEQSRAVKHAIARLDVTILRESLASLAGNEAVESTFALQGAGGTLGGTISRRNLAALRAESAARICIAGLGISLAVVGLIAMFSSRETRRYVVCAVWPLLLGVPALWKWATRLREEVRRYERGYSTRTSATRR